MAWDVVSGAQPGSFVYMPGLRIQRALVYMLSMATLFFWNKMLEKVRDWNRITGGFLTTNSFSQENIYLSFSAGV